MLKSGHTEPPMQADQAEMKRNTNSKASAFTSIVWVLELIDWTLVNWVFLLQVESEDRRVFSRKMKNRKGKKEK